MESFQCKKKGCPGIVTYEPHRGPFVHGVDEFPGGTIEIELTCDNEDEPHTRTYVVNAPAPES